MADILPAEGLDYLLGRVPRGGTAPTNLYLLLFTSQTANTVPGATAVLSTSTGVTEASFPGYARVAIPSSDWGSPDDATIWSATVRAVAASERSFAPASGSSSTPINGFGLASALTGGVALYYSNFDDTTAIASLALGDVIKITPSFGLGG